MTISAWIKATGTGGGGGGRIFEKDGWFFAMSTDAGSPVVRFTCQDSAGYKNSTAIPLNTWVHVACVLDQGVMNAYVNGVRDGSGPGSIVPSPMSGAAIGGNAPSGEAFAGAIDVLRVFRVAHVPQL